MNGQGLNSEEEEMEANRDAKIDDEPHNSENPNSLAAGSNTRGTLHEASRTRSNHEDDRSGPAQAYPPSSRPQKIHRVKEQTEARGSPGDQISSAVAVPPSLETSQLVSEPGQVEAEVEFTLRTLDARYIQLQQQLHQRLHEQQRAVEIQANVEGSVPNRLCDTSGSTSRPQKETALKILVVGDPPPRRGDGRPASRGRAPREVRGDEGRVSDPTLIADPSCQAPSAKPKTADDEREG
jgi:hypothetical protein